MTADQIPLSDNYPELKYMISYYEDHTLPYNLGDYAIAHYTLDVDSTIEELRQFIYLELEIAFAKFNKSNKAKETLRVFKETGMLVFTNDKT